MNPSGSKGTVIRVDTPPRRQADPEAREVLWMLSRASVPPVPPVRAELVGLMDGVELELFSGGVFRRRWRFLRDVVARRYAERVRRRLTARGFRDRRGDERTVAWLVD